MLFVFNSLFLAIEKSVFVFRIIDRCILFKLVVHMKSSRDYKKGALPSACCSDENREACACEDNGLAREVVSDQKIKRFEGEVFSPEQPQFERKVILECPVAGVGFQNIEEIWEELYVGARVQLVREPKNPHDTNAVVVFFSSDYDDCIDNYDSGLILGYIPRKENTAIAAMLDMGWGEKLEAEISELKDRAPYSDCLHITVYLKSREPKRPKDERLRIMFFQEDEMWQSFMDKVWLQGYACFRWGGFPPWEHDLPNAGDRIVFVHQKEGEATLYLMMTIAVGEASVPLFVDPMELCMVDDCYPFVTTVVKGPVRVVQEAVSFLGVTPDTCWQPDYKLGKTASEKLLELFTKEQ